MDFLEVGMEEVWERQRKIIRSSTYHTDMIYNF